MKCFTSTILILTLSLSLCACASHQNAKSNKISQYTIPPSDRFDNTGLIIQAFDLNKDKKSDVWKIYINEEKHSDSDKKITRLLRKEVDSNYDNIVNLWFFYNEKEQLIREEADTNFDKHIDRVTYYANGKLFKREIYLPNTFDNIENSKPIEIKYFKNNALTKIESSSQENELIDRWEIYNKNGKLIQIGHDTNADGTVDNWEHFEHNITDLE